MMNVPFLDLKPLHQRLSQEIEDAVRRVMADTAFAGGPFVEAFEEAFAAYCGSRHAIGVGNGTEALWLAMLALGIGPGDEVITAANTFIATAEAISFTGATPVFVDVRMDTCNMDPAGLEDAISPRTKAVVPVHLFGQTADMDPILAFARQHGLAVIEDASQAHGAEYNGRRAGTLGDVACFSFYPGKNLGACGEAGAVLTNDDALAGKVRMLRDHGQAKKYIHAVVGWNARMDGIQGAILAIKLKHLDHANNARRAHAAGYAERLRDVPGVTLPCEAAGNHHVYHVYAVRVGDRDGVRQRMGEAGVGCAIHYPIPLHLQEAYRTLGMGAGTFPVAERCASEFLSLPMYPELTETQLDYVAEQLTACL